MSSKNRKLKVFGDDVIIAKNDAQVELKLDFEVFCLKCWACEESWELHVNWNLHFWAHVAIGNLKVLNFSGVARKAFSTTARFNTNQLDFDAKIELISIN